MVDDLNTLGEDSSNSEVSTNNNGSIEVANVEGEVKTTTAKVSRITRVDAPSYTYGGGKNKTRIQVATRDTTVNAEDSLKVVTEI